MDRVDIFFGKDETDRTGGTERIDLFAICLHVRLRVRTGKKAYADRHMQTGNLGFGYYNLIHDVLLKRLVLQS